MCTPVQYYKHLYMFSPSMISLMGKSSCECCNGFSCQAGVRMEVWHTIKANLQDGVEATVYCRIDMLKTWKKGKKPHLKLFHILLFSAFKLLDISVTNISLCPSLSLHCFSAYRSFHLHALVVLLLFLVNVLEYLKKATKATRFEIWKHCIL